MKLERLLEIANDLETCEFCPAADIEELCDSYTDVEPITSTELRKFYREVQKELAEKLSPPVGRWQRRYRSGEPRQNGYVSSCCDMWNERRTPCCPYCGTKMEDAK